MLSLRFHLSHPGSTQTRAHTHTHARANTTHRGKHDLQAHFFPTPTETAFPALCYVQRQRLATMQQPRFNVVTVFKSPACSTNIKAPCDTLPLSSSFLFLTIASRGYPDCCCHGNQEASPHHWGIWRQLGVKTPMLLEPYYWMCACVCSGVTEFIVVCSNGLIFFRTIIKQVSHRPSSRHGRINWKPNKDTY